jgi:predicted SnoaL-like aldol condensation-catalyzing enzyme
MDDKDMRSQREAAVEFLQMVVAGDINEAYRKYVAMEGKHHNAYFPAGFPELKKAMSENHDQFPNKQLVVKSVIGDSVLVAVHSHLIFEKGGDEMSVVHIFRFQGDKIVEMWDIGQAIPEDSPNADGAF